MPNEDIIEKIRRYYLDRKTDGRLSLEDIFKDMPDIDAVNVIVEAAKDLPDLILGYDVFPQIKKKLRENEVFFNEMLLKIKDTGINEIFRYIALDFVDSVSRKRADRKLYDETLINLASAEKEKEQLRARALRCLSRSSDIRVEGLVDNALASDSIIMMDTACYLLATQIREGKPLLEKRAAIIAEKALSNVKHVFDMPGLLSVLSNSKNESTQNVLEKLAQLEMTADQLAKFVSAAGTKISDDAFARVVRSCEQNPSAKAQWAVRSILSMQNNRMNALYDKGYHRQFIFLHSLVPDSVDKDSIQRIINLAKSKDPEVADLAHRAITSVRMGAEDAEDLKEIIPVIDKEIPLENLQSALNQSPESEIRKRAEAYIQKYMMYDSKEQPNVHPAPAPLPPNWPKPAAGAFVSGFDIADAMYGELSLDVGNNDHWHSGMCVGFSPFITGTGNSKSIQGEMLGIQVMRLSDAVDYIRETKDFSDAGLDIASAMRELVNGFVFTFRGSEDIEFHGARCPANLTYQQRVNILSTAHSLYSKGIWWTFANMLDYKGWSWDGTVGDIENSRCDGLVEYSYEKNGIRVCGGEDASKWNISNSGEEHVDNHNSLHTFDYEHGELCPRIQAGNQNPDSSHAGANDSTFVVAQPSPPIITDFDVKWEFPFVPSISFRVTSRNYPKVYVRIVVSKDGQPYEFVRTEQPYGNDLSETGDWMFKEVPVNNYTSAKISGWWLGKTASGNDLTLDGNFNFRIVAVDAGGNVSGEVSRVIKLSPQAKYFYKIPYVEKVCILKAPAGQLPVDFGKFPDNQNAGILKYSARWEERNITPGVYRELIVDKNEAIPCKKGLAYVFVKFGPYNSCIEMKDDTVGLVVNGTAPNGSNIQIPVQLRRGGTAPWYYWGTFTPTNSWQSNYRITLEINGISLKSSYRLGAPDGDPLDANPQSVTMLGSNPYNPLAVQLYASEPGADRKHTVEIMCNKVPNPDKFEDNNIIERATDLDLVVNNPWNERLSFHNANDVDFFHIKYPSGSGVKLRGLKTKYFIIVYNESHLMANMQPDDCEQYFSIGAFDSDKTKKRDYSRVTSLDILSPEDNFRNSNMYLSLQSAAGDIMEYDITLRFVPPSWSYYPGEPLMEHEKPLDWLDWPVNEYLSRVNPADIFEDLLHRIDAGRPVTAEQKLQAAEIRYSLGQFAVKLGRYAEAEVLYGASLDILVKNKGTKDLVKQTANELANVYDMQGKRIEAMKLKARYLLIPRI